MAYVGRNQIPKDQKWGLGLRVWGSRRRHFAETGWRGWGLGCPPCPGQGVRLDVDAGQGVDPRPGHVNLEQKEVPYRGFSRIRTHTVPREVLCP